MSIISDLLYEGPYTLSGGLDRLLDRAYDLCRDEAERQNLCLSDALEALMLYPAHIPDPCEVADLMGRDQQGDYQAVTIMTAFLAVKAYLEAEVDSDIKTLEKAIHEATLAGFEAKKLYGTCAHDWMPHDRETDLQHGTVFEWNSRGGSWDAAMIRVPLSEGTEAWIDLAPVD